MPYQGSGRSYVPHDSQVILLPGYQQQNGLFLRGCCCCLLLFVSHIPFAVDNLHGILHILMPETMRPADVKDFFILRPGPDIHGTDMVGVIPVSAAGTEKRFLVPVCGIQVTAYRAHLAGIIRDHLKKVITLPVQRIHHGLLELPAGKDGGPSRIQTGISRFPPIPGLLLPAPAGKIPDGGTAFRTP